MKLPKQFPPVKRPDLIQPHETVDVVHGSVEELVDVQTAVTHSRQKEFVFGKNHRGIAVGEGVLRPQGQFTLAA